MERVLTNLAVNARDAMPSGGRLEIELKNARVDARPSERHVGLEPGDFVVITVSDSGTGMDAATRDRVFEPFFSTKAPGQGTGLGLSTVHSIVQQAGGYLSVDSELGRGTRFEIFLPLAEPVSATTHSGGDDVPTRAAAPDIEVLVVDDEPAVAALLGEVLELNGYRSTVMNDPRAALACAEREVGVALREEHEHAPTGAGQLVHQAQAGLGVLHAQVHQGQGRRVGLGQRRRAGDAVGSSEGDGREVLFEILLFVGIDVDEERHWARKRN